MLNIYETYKIRLEAAFGELLLINNKKDSLINGRRAASGPLGRPAPKAHFFNNFDKFNIFCQQRSTKTSAPTLKSFSPEKLLSTPRARAAHSPLTKWNTVKLFSGRRMEMLDRLIPPTSREELLSRGAPSARAQSFNKSFTKSENISHLNGGATCGETLPVSST